MREREIMRELNGYYYCLSYSEDHHELYSAAEFSHKEMLRIAYDSGARLYLVKYRNSVKQGKKKRIPIKL